MVNVAISCHVFYSSLGTTKVVWFVLLQPLMPTIQTADPATGVLKKFDFFDSVKHPTYAALSESSNIPVSTLWGPRPWTTTEKRKSSKAAIPHSSRGISSQNGYPIPVKFLRSLAQVIIWQRSSTFKFPSTDKDVQLRCILDVGTL